MTKFCTNCGTEVKKDAKFCPKCGFNLNESDQTENNIDSSTDIKTKSKGILSFLDDWKEWGTGKKIGSIILVCCIGLIIIGAIGGIMFPDLNTSEKRFYMTDSSFVIPDGCTVRESGDGASMAILVQKDGTEVFVNEHYTPKFSDYIIDSNETINVDGVDVHKIKYHWKNGVSFTDYVFNKENIDYCIVFNQQTEPNDDMAASIVKSMDTAHGNINDHKNTYSGSSSDNSDKVNRYDSYTGGSSSNPSNDKSDSHSSDTNDNLGKSNLQVRITCKGGWKGDIGVGLTSATYSGNGDKIIDLDGSSSDTVVAVIQKDSGGNGKLKVEIIKNGKVKKEASTTSGYGVVSVSD